MIERDKRIRKILKDSFPAHKEKEKELYCKIVSQLPQRDNRYFIIAIAYTILSLSMLIFLIFNIKTISNCITTSITFMQELVQTSEITSNLLEYFIENTVNIRTLPQTEDPIAIVLYIAIIFFIIWYIYSMLNEYYLFKNENIIKRAIEEKR